MKIYTKTGDDGTTSLGNGKRVPKCDTNIQSIGDIDELNSHIGLLVSIWTVNNMYAEYLFKLQNILFDIGSMLANPNKINNESEFFIDKELLFIENEIDRITELLPQLNAFIIPGGNQITAQLHIIRTVCRRAERSLIQCSANKCLIKFINRLSDYFFTLARHSIILTNGNEIKYINWKKR